MDRRAEHVEAVAADRDHVLVGCCELGAERRARRPAAARCRIVEVRAGLRDRQVVMHLVLRDGLVEHDAIVVEHLADAVRQPFRVDRVVAGARLGIVGQTIAPLGGGVRAFRGARGESLRIVRRDQLARLGLQRLDHRQRVSGEPQVGGEFHRRDAALRGLDVGHRNPGAIGRRVGVGEPGNVHIECEDDVGVLEMRLAHVERMVEREALVGAQARLRDRQAEQFAEPHQGRDRRRIAAGARHQHERVLRFHQPLRDFADARGVGRGGPRDAELVHRGKLRAVHLVQRNLARQREIHRPAWFGARHLQGARDHQAWIVLDLHAVIPFGVLPHDGILVEALLQPDVAAAVPRAVKAAGIAGRRTAAGDDDGQAGVKRGVHRAAIVLRAAIDMRRGHRGLTGHRGVAERGVEAGVFVRHGDQLGRGAAVGVRLGDGLLVEADLRPRGEEDVLDAGLGHRRDHGVAVVVGGNFDPRPRVVAQISGVLVHGSLPRQCGGSLRRFSGLRQA